MSSTLDHVETPSDRPWLNPAKSPDERAALLEEALSEDERFSLLHGIMAVPFRPGMTAPPDAIPGAGYFPPIPRVGFPGIFESDASLGVTNPGGVRPGDTATALPSGLALASTWNAELAYRSGAAIGDEAAKKGFNVLLAGGVNLTREPRNGRNFEYLGEDPLLAGIMAGESIRGIQSNGIVSTAKHFVLNDQETGRHVSDAVIDEAALRESDLLAFQIAIERGQPGAVMAAYNKVNGYYAAENEALLSGVLKGDWGYRGWVMSDWGGTTTGVTAAKAGLDQQSGEQLDYRVWFEEPLREAVVGNQLPAERISDMARRILRSMFAAGLFDQPSRKGQPIDYETHGAIAQTAAEQGIVLLKNQRALLPIGSTARRILVVGGQADAGVLSGGGSSQVTTGKRHAAVLRVGGEAEAAGFASEAYHPASPLKAIRARAPAAEVRFVTGRYPSEAAALARDADLAIVFATQWMSEGADAPDLSLPNGQDALIAEVAAANHDTVAVLQTGGPVLMPWLDQVGAVLEAWYPGGRGGEAIAAVLFGEVNPSGRLPMTFPRSLDQLPRPQLPGFGVRWASPGGSSVDLSAAPGFVVPHEEGSEVGYRWFARERQRTLFPFGFGLSYTSFSYAGLEVSGGQTVSVSCEVTNTGARPGADVPQLYLTARNGVSKQRLLGWSRLELQPGESRRVSVTADPRLLADFDVSAKGWRIAPGRYEIAIGRSAEDLALHGSAEVGSALLKP